MSGDNIFFKRISSRFTIREKIEFAAFKYNNNYFLDQEPSEITNLPNEIVRPLVKITKDNLNEAVSRDHRAKTKKLAWVMKQLDDEKFSSFARQLDEFTSVSAAESEAAKLFREHCKDYSISQATIKKVDGKKVVIRRAAVPAAAVASTSSSEGDIASYKQQLLDQPLVERIREIISMKPTESATAVSNPNDDDDLAYGLKHFGQSDYSKLTKHTDRQIVLFLAQINEWLKQKLQVLSCVFYFIMLQLCVFYSSFLYV